MRLILFVLLLVLGSAPLTATPLRFEPNRGQTDPAVHFLVRGATGTAFLTADGLVLGFRDGDRSARLTLRFDGAAAPHLEGVGPRPGVTHYLRGPDPADWVRHVPGYAAVRYDGLYPGLGLTVGDAGGALAFELTAEPDALAAFALAVDGALHIGPTPEGGLRVRTPLGERVLAAPRVRSAAGAIHAGRFVVDGEGLVQVEGGTPVPTTPARPGGDGYATFLGGVGDETGRSIVTDAEGNSYVTGDTSSPDFPGAPPVVPASIDVFVTKLAPDGLSLVYSTLVIGMADELGFGIARLADGSVVVTGQTESPDFPTTPGAFDPSYNGGGTDAFVFRLSPDGASLLYSTFVGGSGMDFGRDIAADAKGAAFATGGTSSPDFPTTPGVVGPGPLGGDDTFAVKVTPDGAGLFWGTYLGGSGGEFANSIALLAGDAFITGETVSPDLPTTPGVFGPTFAGGSDAFVAHLAPDASAFAYLTYLGGPGADMGEGIAVDATGTAFVGGITASGFPVTPDAAFPTPSGLEDAFLTVLSPDASGLAYSTYYGGSDLDFGCDVALDDTGLPVLVGKTNSADLPMTPGAPQPVFGGITDGWYARFDPGLTGAASFLHATFIGGTSPDIAHAVASDPAGVIHITGFTESADFPVSPDAFDDTFNGGIKDVMIRRVPKDFLPVATEAQRPGDPSVSPPAPNPFRTHAALTVTLAAPEVVRATLVDARGRTVAVVWDGPMPAGATLLRLDGSALPSGVYLLRLSGDSFAESRRVTLFR